MKKLILGNKWLQGFFWHLYKISLKGMNYDRGHVPSANGEPFVIDQIIGNSTQKKIIFDVGANRGQYLEMIISKNISKSQIEIHCFEPQKNACIHLFNIAKDKKNIYINNLGLSSSPGNLTLYKDSDASELGSIYKANYKQYNIELSSTELVSVDTLDQYCAKNNIKSIDLLKIDVEGHELEVLKGAIGLLKSGMIKNIQFEFGLAAIESRIFLKDFFSLLNNYDIYRILPNSLFLIDDYSEYHEIFLTTNYLAKIKP